MEWISVKDKLPEKGISVFCYSLTDGYVVDSFRMMIGNEPEFNGTREYWRTDITHWMPLPEPPTD